MGRGPIDRGGITQRIYFEGDFQFKELSTSYCFLNIFEDRGTDLGEPSADAKSTTSYFLGPTFLNPPK